MLLPPTPKAFFTLSPLQTLISDDLTRLTVKSYSHSAGGATVDTVVMDTLALVKGRLGGRLRVIGLETAGYAVRSVRDSFLDLLLGRLGRVRSDLLLSLCDILLASCYLQAMLEGMRQHTCGEILAAGVGHDE